MDNTVLNGTTVAGGDTVRDILKGGVKTQVVTLDLGGAGAESLIAGTMPVSASSLPLPAGASTAANQQTNALTDAQLRAVAVPVSGTFYQSTQPVSAVSLPLPGGAAMAALQQNNALTDTQLRASAVAVSNVSLPLPAGAATAANQQTNALTDAQLRASAVAVSGTFWQATQPVSIAATVAVNNSQIGGVAISAGAGASNTGTQRVILATDQTTVPFSIGLSFTTFDSGHLTSPSVLATTTVTLDGPQITSGTGKLFEATVSSSVALKAQLGTWDGTTFVVKRTFFVAANTALVYTPTRYDEITMTTGTVAKFRWSITNNGALGAADVYASITHAI